MAAAVWKPVEARVRGKRLLIVADGPLQYVPFAALPASGGQPLLARHEIVSLPSASVLETLRRDSRPVSRTAAAAVFADPVFSKNDPRFAGARDSAAPAATRAADGGLYARLRFSRREAETIAAAAPAAFQALDFAAAKATLAGRDLRRYRILHFATHGTLNTEHPELSGLVFSLVDKSGKPIDGFLRLHEIYKPGPRRRPGRVERLPHRARERGPRRGPDRPHPRLHVRRGLARRVERLERGRPRQRAC